jgi:hypothetical protein
MRPARFFPVCGILMQRHARRDIEKNNYSNYTIDGKNLKLNPRLLTDYSSEASVEQVLVFTCDRHAAIASSSR